jgi:formate hydrogenlyase transcriptional activator
VTLAENERRHVARVLARTGGRIYGEGGAAEILGLPPTTLQSRMKKLGVGRRP